MKVMIRIGYSEERIEFTIDEQDLHLLIGECYQAAKRNGKYYLFNRSSNKYFHRLVTDAPKNMWVDHIDGDPTNNQRSNLRLVNPRQNSYNQAKQKTPSSSQFKGVCKYPKNKNKPYRAYINYEGKRINLGYYATEVDAAKAYNIKAAELFGEYARLNEV